MKPGLFKKILNSENQADSPAVAAANTAPSSHLPPPRNPDSPGQSHDPFEGDEDFGFGASDIEPEPVSPDPTFAIPEEKQMSQSASTPPPAPDSPTEYESIRQLELRAIFGVDHEMNVDEILKRSRELKGIRQVSRLADGDAGTIETLKAMISRLGFGNEPVRIYAGSIPVEFIREGHIALAVQTDGGYAPGVRETLILVARELAKM